MEDEKELKVVINKEHVKKLDFEAAKQYRKTLLDLLAMEFDRVMKDCGHDLKMKC